jgi:hypothetical protein
VGQPVPTGRAIPAVGECDAAARAPDLALVDVATGVRRLWRLEGGSWREATPLRGVGGGPTPGGPVGLGSTAYLPVIDASTDPWRFSVYLLGGETWTLVAGRPVNQGIGNAQGVIG